MSNKTQTAVEWLKSQKRFYGNIVDSDFDYALKLEKEQIIQSFGNGAIDASYGNKYNNAEHYYTQTYGDK